MNTHDKTNRDSEQAMIRRLLDEDFAESNDTGDIQQLRQMIADSLRSKVRFLSILGFVLTLVFLALAVTSVVQFFRTPESDVRGLILWATLFMTAATQIVLVKVWFWINWNRNSVVRELKRLELRLASSKME